MKTDIVKFFTPPVIEPYDWESFTLSEPNYHHIKQWLAMAHPKHKQNEKKLKDNWLSPYYNKHAILKMAVDTGYTCGRWVIHYEDKDKAYLEVVAVKKGLEERGIKVDELNVDAKYSAYHVKQGNRIIGWCVYVYNKFFYDKETVINIGEAIIDILDPKSMYYEPNIFDYLRLKANNEFGIDIKLHRYRKKTKSWI